MTRILATKRQFLCGVAMVATTLTLRGAQPALAQDERPGRVTTRSFARLGVGLAIAVASLDDNPSTDRVREEIERLLAKAGHRVVTENAAWRLTFTSEIRVPVPADRSSRASPAPGSDAATPSEMGHDQLPDRPFRPGASSSPREGHGRLRHVINMSLADTATSRIRWQGHVRYDSIEPDPTVILVQLVPILLAEFGRTVTERRFRLN